MKSRYILGFLFVTFSVCLLLPTTQGYAATKLNENAYGYGFVFQSKDFGAPCTQDPGGIPILYQNLGTRTVDVSIQIVNTGNSILFPKVNGGSPGGVGIVIPPDGGQRRPKTIRFAVPALTGNVSGTVGLSAQTPDCKWFAIIHPH